MALPDRETYDGPTAGAGSAADWWLWRGRMEVEQKTNADRITDIGTGINERLTDLGAMIARRLDAQDREIAATLEQAKKTNGRMTDAESDIGQLKERLAHSDGEREGEGRVEIRQERVEVRRTDMRRFRLTTLVAVAAATGTLVGAIEATIRIFG